MKKTSTLKKFIKFVSVSALVLIKLAFLLYIGFSFLIIWSANTSYYFFGKNRTAEMEETFGIKVTDDIKLKKYEGFSFLAKQDFTLYISGIDDYGKFMQNNVKGKIIRKVEDGIICNYKEKTQEVSDYYEKDDVIYTYMWDGYNVTAEFYKDDDESYSVMLNKFD